MFSSLYPDIFNTPGNMIKYVLIGVQLIVNIVIYTVIDVIETRCQSLEWNIQILIIQSRGDDPVNTKHLYNFYTTSNQRLRRWSIIV